MNMHNATAIANPNDKWFSIDVISCMHFRTIRPKTPFEISVPQQSCILLNSIIFLNTLLSLECLFECIALKFTFTDFDCFPFSNFKRSFNLCTVYSVVNKVLDWKCQCVFFFSFLCLCIFDSSCQCYSFTGHCEKHSEACSQSVTHVEWIGFRQFVRIQSIYWR